MSKKRTDDTIELTEALEDFVATVEAAGGVFTDPDGNTCPHGDPSWTDLGDSYLHACRILKRAPLVIDEDFAATR